MTDVGSEDRRKAGMMIFPQPQREDTNFDCPETSYRSGEVPERLLHDPALRIYKKPVDRGVLSRSSFALRAESRTMVNSPCAFFPARG